MIKLGAQPRRADDLMEWEMAELIAIEFGFKPA
jgi:hypothetical protein